ncbi:peptidase M23 [Microbacterium sp. CH12i]|uniref:hypothetical protein n=1 Tax=Microbacterium sp. CH12i TaxID=1479651 RepID=UPI000461EF90|nr:hypothetical protein [Microbacterium sp. CH12i]KDA06123.1 peptidase M23 [Microbacterium sp. CH12i]
MSTTRTRRTRKSRRRTRSAWPAILILGTLTLTVLLAVLVPLAASRDPLALCVDEPASFPASGIAGWKGDQLENAATIMRTATVQGFDHDGQVIGVMAAMGESTLHNIGYGDWETSGVENPDGSRTTSIGLFQQQEWWGSVETRMDPASAAALFYERLGRLTGWQDMTPSHAIHDVQINTDSEHYARFEDDATTIVDALSGPCPA